MLKKPSRIAWLGTYYVERSARCWVWVRYTYVSESKRFYRDIKSAVSVNGRMSSWFSIKRGCRQGDPVSPYLFLLCVDILAIMIQQNQNINGIVINKTEYKISQYADDTEIILYGDKRRRSHEND